MSAPIFLALRIALSVVLYAFLGWALYTVWKDLRQQSAPRAGSLTPALTLTVASQDEPQVYQFSGSEIIVGRDPISDCHLMDQTISARHTRLVYHHNQWWVEDLHSTNGTFLNQEPVTESIVITSGDQLRCGQVMLNVSIENSEIPEGKINV
jgi:pSer/pThr/pTyr-binding forkhead associated (FHA) protein